MRVQGETRLGQLPQDVEERAKTVQTLPVLSPEPTPNSDYMKSDLSAYRTSSYGGKIFQLTGNFQKNPIKKQAGFMLGCRI